MGFGEMGIGSERELGEGAVYAQIEEDRLFQGRGREGVAAQTEAVTTQSFWRTAMRPW